MTMPHRLLVLTLCTALLSAPALAQDEALVAEQERLIKELQSLVSREAWDGAERAYLELLSMESQGLEVTYAEHILGAQAAQQRGDVVSTRKRLESAIAQWETDLARNWLDELNNNFGAVSITLPRGRTAVSLQPDDMPFEPERRFAIEFAQARLDTDRAFEGELPVGSYTIGGQSFTVTAGQTATVTVEQAARPVAEEDPDPKPSRSGDGSLVSGRLRLGVGYARAGTPSAGIQPASFGGMSPRLGGGIGLHFTDSVGMGLELGWTGAFASPNRLSLGYGVLTAEATLPAGPGITAGIGPMVAVGSGQATGIDADALAEYCAGVQDNSCNGYESNVDSAAASSVLEGGVQAVGPALSLHAPLFEAGAMVGSGGLLLSALSDSSRWYPAAQIALQVAVGGRR